MVNAKKAIAALEYGFSRGDSIHGGAYPISSCYFRKGQKIRAVMVFGKSNTNAIEAKTRMENIDLLLVKDKTGKTVASSTSTRNNVEIIEYTFTESGEYHFLFKPIRVMSTAFIPIGLAWQIV